MEDAVIPALPTRAGHIKKRALKNKSLTVSFDEKDLRDYLTGFHKRKKKRRKEAHKQQDEAARRKRIEQRKKRKLEKEFAVYGGAPPSIDTVPDESDEHHEDDEDGGPLASVNATTMYDNGEMQVTVTTSEISREDKDEGLGDNTPAARPSGSRPVQNLSVSKKKSFKKVAGHSSRSKPQKKKDKNKGKRKNKKR